MRKDPYVHYLNYQERFQHWWLQTSCFSQVLGVWPTYVGSSCLALTSMSCLRPQLKIFRCFGQRSSNDIKIILNQCNSDIAQSCQCSFAKQVSQDFEGRPLMSAMGIPNFMKGAKLHQDHLAPTLHVPIRLVIAVRLPSWPWFQLNIMVVSSGTS